jgi:chromatin assembly factor 1 subunit B
VYISSQEEISEGKHVSFCLLRHPAACVTGFKKAAIAVRCNPLMFKLKRDQESAMIRLPYRIVYAVITQDEVLIYDSEQGFPLAVFKNLHYASLTDASW